jgi:phage shock protein A
VFGALVEQRVIEAIPTHKVDSMQGMWQRALRAKTAAIDKLRDELDSAYERVHELEMERDARDAADAFADTTPLERATEQKHFAAQSTAMSILHELRSDVEEREKRLDSADGRVATRVDERRDARARRGDGARRDAY